MRRRQLFQTLGVALFGILFVAAGIGLAAPPDGKGPDKGGGGSDDGGTPEPTPLTFMVHWLPDQFAANEFNNHGDAIGTIASTDANGDIRSEALFHDGSLYGINEIVNDPAWDIYLLKDISNRIDGHFFVVGIGILDGVYRGVRLTFAEAVNGGSPALIEMLTLAPIPGDTRSGAAAVNSSGNVVVMSKSADDTLHEIYFYDAETGQQVPGSASWQTSDVYHARLNELNLLLHHYTDTETGEIRILMWDPATDWWESWGNDRTAQAINNFGDFCGGRNVVVGAKGKKTTTANIPYLFNGQSFYDFTSYERAFASDINDNGDILLSSNHLSLSGYGQVFDIWTMLDPANSYVDLNEFSRFSNVSTFRLSDGQWVLGRGQYFDSSRGDYVRRSFYLIPTSP